MFQTDDFIDQKFITEYANDELFKEVLILLMSLEEQPTVESSNKFSKIVKEMISMNFYSKELIEFLKDKDQLYKKRLDRSVGEELGNFIKEERLRQKLSLVQLEELTGVSGSYINRLEKGERNAPSLLIVDKIAQGLGIPFIVLAKKAGIHIGTEKEDCNDNKFANLKPISELIKENRVSLRNMGPEMTEKDKAMIIDIIDLIANADWHNNEEESFDTLNLLVKKFHQIN